MENIIIRSCIVASYFNSSHLELFIFVCLDSSDCLEGIGGEGRGHIKGGTCIGHNEGNNRGGGAVGGDFSTGEARTRRFSSSTQVELNRLLGFIEDVFSSDSMSSMYLQNRLCTNVRVVTWSVKLSFRNGCMKRHRGSTIELLDFLFFLLFGLLI